MSDEVPASMLPGARVHLDAMTSCVFLIATDGTELAALWPAGWRARKAPLRIYNERDKLIWQEGVARDLSGGPSEVGVERLPASCRRGTTAFWVAPF